MSKEKTCHCKGAGVVTTYGFADTIGVEIPCPDCRAGKRVKELNEQDDEYKAGCWGRWCARLIKKNKQLEAELDKHRWIPVSERLPEEEKHPEAIGHSKNVWCYDKSLRMPYWVDCYDVKYKVWLVSGKSGPACWMPIIPLEKDKQ